MEIKELKMLLTCWSSSSDDAIASIISTTPFWAKQKLPTSKGPYKRILIFMHCTKYQITDTLTLDTILHINNIKRLKMSGRNL